MDHHPSLPHTLLPPFHRSHHTPAASRHTAARTHRPAAGARPAAGHTAEIHRAGARLAGPGKAGTTAVGKAGPGTARCSRTRGWARKRCREADNVKGSRPCGFGTMARGVRRWRGW